MHPGSILLQDTLINSFLIAVHIHMKKGWCSFPSSLWAVLNLTIQYQILSIKYSQSVHYSVIWKQIHSYLCLVLCIAFHNISTKRLPVTLKWCWHQYNTFFNSHRMSGSFQLHKLNKSRSNTKYSTFTTDNVPCSFCCSGPIPWCDKSKNKHK